MKANINKINKNIKNINLYIDNIDVVVYINNIKAAKSYRKGTGKEVPI